MPTDNQLEFHLPAPPVSGDTPLIPARMVNEFVYCPRLAYLMWTQGERCIRGARASASLKPKPARRLLYLVEWHPRRTRLGLIEAAEFCAPHFHSRSASEAHAPRPH